MVSRRGFLALLGAGGVAVVGGGAVIALLPGDDGPGDGPPRITFGGESCLRCGMLVGDPRFAAGWRDGKGKEAHFDDIGCMIVQSRETPPAAPAHFWVHDYHTEQWIAAETASFAVDDSIRSPMAYGIAAAAAPDDARSLAPNVELTSWSNLLNSVKGRG
ncbi:MAG: nitrous oxide reductase accessory protein NosL [Dehalococcoidia bacterium]|nr:nitrous oxide reductase accessory protein NosL [Dehalococcoidia bacterium]